jgi:hypothetical protein
MDPFSRRHISAAIGPHLSAAMPQGNLAAALS